MLKRAIALLTVAGLFTSGLLLADKIPQALPTAQREAALKAMRAGNFKDAYTGFRKLALDPNDDPEQVVADLNNAVNCLGRLGRWDEMDDFREGVVAAHKGNWRLLQAAAVSYQNTQHYGFIVAGKFQRGNKRGGGKYVSSVARDRVRALQLMSQALPLAANDPAKAAAAQFHLDFANMLLLGGNYHEAWRLQALTDLTQLPDYEEGGYYGWDGQQRGAPVDADGNPVFHHIPKSYEGAKSDGERWRWMLHRVAELAPARTAEVQLLFANFLYNQFGEQTIAQFGWRPRAQDDLKKDTSGTYALHTLGEDETIARLATGVKRFKLPDEFNFLKIFQQVAENKDSSGRGNRGAYSEQARDTIARIFENRRQYVKAEVAWRKAVEEYGPGHQNYRQRELDQIVGNWGRFEPMQPQAAGKDATVDFRFRNGKKVHFEAHAVKVGKLLADVKAYLKAGPSPLDWRKMNVANLGYALVQENQAQYVGDRVAAWDLDLKPRPNHVDDRVTVTTPLRKAGVYLLTAKVDGGNVSRIIVWLNDTVLVKKTLDGRMYYYVADAVTGQPVPRANVEFFGYKQTQVAPNARGFRVTTRNFAELTDADGQVVLGPQRQPQDHSWVITATTPQGRLAYLGFTGVWYGRPYDPEYNQTKVFVITDRPVYRPLQTAHFKLWVGHAKYDIDDNAAAANRPVSVVVTNPKGEKVLERNYTTDAYGGIEGDLALPKDATLGVYAVQAVGLGGGSFRVEEYKKPEFEVKVEAPKEPVSLGETITATVQAKYYFGAPVVNAKVKYKVLRNSYSERWYPVGRWDWLYGPGYWWFAADYVWYPGWANWGCRRPFPIWWHQPPVPPEVVAESEGPIGPDGTVQVKIDTQVAKELHGDEDHRYTITAEVVDESRRTIVGTGEVLVARKPFKVHAWVDRGHYRVGDTVNASFDAHTLDRKPVQGKGELTLYRISYDADKKPVEKAVMKWDVDPNAEGRARQQLVASEAGQYRLSYKVTDSKKHTIEGGYLFVVRGQGFDGREFRFNDLELITDKREYAPGETVKLLINTNRQGAAVLLFLRPTNGAYLPPKVIRLEGKSKVEEIAVARRDMPNFFIEALTVARGEVFTETREVVVPPEQRVINIAVEPSQTEYLPGAPAKVRVKLTDLKGKPFVGSTVLTVYDRSVDYIAGGSNVPEIKEFFWKWRRHHYPQTDSSLNHWLGNLLRQGETAMSNLGLFGASVVEEMEGAPGGKGDKGGQAQMLRSPASGATFTRLGGIGGPGGMAPGMAAPAEAATALGAYAAEGKARALDKASGKDANANGLPAGPPDVVPTLRSNFADTACWAGALETDKDGVAEVSFKMPENLTGWKVKAWALGRGTKVGQGEAEVVTRKNILVRTQAPRFFVERDEVVLSANVHNYLKADKSVTVQLELAGTTLAPLSPLAQRVTIKSGEDRRVDWKVRVEHEGEAVVRMKALTDEESDAVETKFPAYVHGMLKTESFSGAIRPDKDAGRIKLTVPAERRVNDSRLEVRFSPTLAGAMVDALPYLVDYPYGCTEQTLNRFLPTLITHNVLGRMNLDLKDIRDKRTNLNAQEIGDPKERAKGWKRYPRNPVFDSNEVRQMVKDGLQRLTQMQLSDGGWGWFSGWGEHSYPHTTAVVVHGLQVARQNELALVPGVLEKGVAWLKNYQAEQVQHIKNAPTQTHPWKSHADNLDAFVYMVLIDEDVANNDMLEFLYRDRVELSVYGKALLGLALHKQKQADKLTMVLRNIEQFLVQDDENQTAHLRLPEGNARWYWYGSETEAHAYYLKLLSRTNPKDEKASRLVKYLLNNRKHATYWNSTRDTALAIEALADYIKASGEDRPDMTVEVYLDGKKQREVKVDRSNLFTFDSGFVLFGDAVETGEHVVELRKKGTGPLYYNAYLTNFTLEDFITKAGLEVKVNRKYYKLTRADKEIKVSGARGQALGQKAEKYERTELPNLAALKSGDLVEIELEIDSKNDYEYLMFEDMKAAGFEPVAVRSGYTNDGLGAYVEYRDERVCFFVRWLARGKHSVSYRLRAETPGRFSALPARASAMYAPELKGNSDEIKLTIAD